MALEITIFIGLLVALAWCGAALLFLRREMIMSRTRSEMPPLPFSFFSAAIVALLLTLAGLIVAMEEAKKAALPATQGILTVLIVVAADMIGLTTILGMLGLTYWMYGLLREANSQRKKGRMERGEDG